MAELPPATLEGWYALHQVFSQDWAGLRALAPQQRVELSGGAQRLAEELATPEAGGWSAAFRLVGGGGDWMWVHFRRTLDELAEVQLALRRSAFGSLLRLEYDYTSVTEASLYHATAEAARHAGSDAAEFRHALDEAAAAELASPHVRSRLYPEPPQDMQYVSFYPMTKRRTEPDNWYSLPVDERSRLMSEHGLTGRRYAGRIFQVITGSIGLDDWEWGVTLFARDPLDFKKIVTEMRYDEASARYGEFGSFYTGLRVRPQEWPQLMRVE
jgi:peroxiredoxin